MKTARIFLTLLALTGLLIGCKDRAEANAERTAEAIPVTLAPARLGSVQRTVEIFGTLHGDEEVTLSAKVPGRIVQVLKDVGDRVKTGEPLAQIDKTDYELAVSQKKLAVSASLAKLGLTELPPDNFDLSKVPTVERARLQSANAQAKLERARKLHDQVPPLMSDQDYADLETTFEVAKSNSDVELLTARSLLADARAMQSELALEEQRLRDTTIVAPSDSAVGSRSTSVGEYVREGTPLFRVVADDPIKFRAPVPERFLSQVKVGQDVRVRIEAYPDTFAGKVSRISPQIDVTNRTFQVEVLIPNKEGRLGAGSFARGEVLTRVDENVLLVPTDAVVTFAGVSKVFAVADGKAVEYKLETGQKVDAEIELVKGMEKPEPVVIEGKNRLTGGTPVVVKPATTVPTTRP